MKMNEWINESECMNKWMSENYWNEYRIKIIKYDENKLKRTQMNENECWM